MIAIISKQDLEESTNEVIDWLKYYKAEYIRLNGNEYLKRISIDLSNKKFVEEKEYEQVNICWFRRWYNDNQFLDLVEKVTLSNKNSINLIENLYQSSNILTKVLHSKLKYKKWLTHPNELKYHKIEILIAAQQSGLKIPETIITTSKDELLKFKSEHKRIITKSIGDASHFVDEKSMHKLMTEEISEKIIQQIPSYFPPSLFQALLKKEYEIRIFYFNKKFYSMAIFSQQDRKTQIDFRNYNDSNPNRNIPYNLPADIRKKLLLLIRKFKFTTCSIDLVKDQNGDYIFLEINPIGQFGMVSDPCNYYLFEKIATYLIKNDCKRK
jgi:ATP-GRASP peptide maturase of grasp-with-spasm system